MNQINYLVVLKDGKSELATWSQDPSGRPTVGERIQIPAAVLAAITGFGPSGNVTKVEIDQRNHAGRIEVEAESTTSIELRPVLTLNASLIPENLRQLVESHLRAGLESPVLEWEESFDSKPIVRVHQLKGGLQTPLETLQSEVLGILKDHSELAVI
jgi:hypothetical protein